MTGQRPTLVVVDDEQGILDVVSRFARRTGFDALRPVAIPIDLLPVVHDGVVDRLALSVHPGRGLGARLTIL